MGGAVSRALTVAGADAIRVVLLGPRRHADRIHEGLRIEPPPEAGIRVGSRPGLLVADATSADERSLRRLARALPRRRPLDAIAYVTDPDGQVEEGGAELAGRFSRLLGLRTALHLVVPPPAETDLPAFEPCPVRDAPDALALARGLRERLMHGWLCGGYRPKLATTESGAEDRMGSGVTAVLQRLGQEPLTLASLAWGGRGLEAALASTWDRTVPDRRRGLGIRAALAALATGVLLGATGAVTQAERAAEVEDALFVLAPVLAGAVENPGALVGERRARRFARAAAALERAAGPNVASPLSALHPGAGALRTLAQRTLTDAVVRPAELAARGRIARALGPESAIDPDAWLDRAGALLAGVHARDASPAAAILAAAYGTPEGTWRRIVPHARPDRRRTGAPAGAEATDGFVATMGAWARLRYANGPLPEAAKRAAGHGAGWRERMKSLQTIEAALGAGEGRWLSSGGAELDPDPELERLLARARGVLDEEAVERGREAALREAEKARRQVADLRLGGGASPLVVLDAGEGPALGPAARRLLRAYEALAGEDLLAGPRNHARATAPAGLPARRLLASLEGLELRLAETRLDPPLREALVVELEAAAFDEVATRIEAASDGPLASSERDALQAIERLARAKGAYRAASRIGAVQASRDEATAVAAQRAIEEEDPLAVGFDRATDRQAVLDRVLAGVERLDALYRLRPAYGERRWEQLGRELRGYRNGDPSSVLTRMVERVRDYAHLGPAGCGAPVRIAAVRARPALSPPVGGSASYAERAYAAFERRLEAVCRESAERAAGDVANRLRSFFDAQLAWRWPYSDEPGAPAAPRSTVNELLRRAEGRDAGALDPDLETVVRSWSRDRQGDPVLELAVEWRTAPGRERNAEHLVSYRLDGLQELASGRRGWRYGDRLDVRLRLAKDSPLRFTGGALEATVPIGRGSWVGRLATGARAASLTIEAPVADRHGGAGERLRISATLTAVRARPGSRDWGRTRPLRAMPRPVRASPGPLAVLP